MSSLSPETTILLIKSSILRHEGALRELAGIRVLARQVDSLTRYSCRSPLHCHPTVDFQDPNGKMLRRPSLMHCQEDHFLERAIA